MLALSFFVGVGPVPRVAAQLAPTDAELAEAKEHYRTGTEHLKASEHAAALESFERSFALYASPNTALALGRILTSMGRNAEAVRYYTRAIELVDALIRKHPEYASTRRRALAERKALDSSVARIVLDAVGVPPGTALEVAGRDIPPTEWNTPVPVQPGTIVVRASAPGYRTFEREIGVGAGDSEAVRIELVEAEVRAAPPVTERAPVVAVAPSDSAEEEGGSSAFPVLGWSFAGLAIAGAASTVVFFVLTGGQESTYEDECGKAPCSDAHAKALKSTGDTYALVTNISLGVTIGSAALAALFLLVLDDGEEAPSETGVTWNGLGLSGRF